MLLAWPVPTCTACCSRIGSRQILSIFQIRPNLRSPTAFGRKTEQITEITHCSHIVKNQLFCCPKAVPWCCNYSVRPPTCTMTMPCLKTAFVKPSRFMLRIVLKRPIINFFAVQKLFLALIGQPHQSALTK
jgi:hypothetical protein